MLLPFSLLYKSGVILHNKIYDLGLKKISRFDVPVICVGNLSVGGTGKTPMVEYLLRLLTPDHKVATVSRGYRRRSKGVMIATDNITSDDIGDEPMQFYTKFKNTNVVVGEKRADAMQMLLQQHPDTEVIILDDAFQHRAVAAGLNILLTEYNNLYNTDYYLPAGQLRDLKSNSAKADIIIVTKCPDELTDSDAKIVINVLQLLPSQKVYFTAYHYGKPLGFLSKKEASLNDCNSALLVSGIANPAPLAAYLKRHDISLKIKSFADHHAFNLNDIKSIIQLFEQMPGNKKWIITTEKDAMRLKNFESMLAGLPVFIIPVEHRFLFSQEESFQQQVFGFIKSK